MKDELLHAMFRAHLTDKIITILGKFFQTFGRVDFVLHDESRHRTARAFGKKTDDFVIAFAQIFKHGCNHRHAQCRQRHRFEVFI